MAKSDEVLTSVPDTTPPAVPEIRVDETRSVTKKRAREVSQSETVLQALMRILGDAVLDVIPEGVRGAVDAAYKFWQTHPDSFLVTDFDSQQSRDDALTVMKAYAEIAPEGPWTIRVDHDSAEHVLHWRAQTRQGRKAAGE